MSVAMATVSQKAPAAWEDARHLFARDLVPYQMRVDLEHPRNKYGAAADWDIPVRSGDVI